MILKFFLKSKIHKAIVTEANLNYIGSITICKELMNKSGLEKGEKVLVVDNTNGARLETYVIPSKKKGFICMNGAAAHLIKKGDEVIIMSFGLSERVLNEKNILVNKKNEFIKYL